MTESISENNSPIEEIKRLKELSYRWGCISDFQYYQLKKYPLLVDDKLKKFTFNLDLEKKLIVYNLISNREKVNNNFNKNLRALDLWVNTLLSFREDVWKVKVKLNNKIVWPVKKKNVKSDSKKKRKKIKGR